MMKKLVKGKIAVLVSYGYGAGWYSWHENKAMLFDPNIIEMVLEEAGETAIAKYCQVTYPDECISGIEGLTVEYVTPGTKFRIDEYDGSETIIREEDDDWIIA